MSKAPIAMDPYALIEAGLSDGLPLAELLAHLGVEEAVWETGRAHWQELVLNSLNHGPAMVLQLDALQREARLAWQREVVPIENDLGAWLAFEWSFSRAVDPMGFVKALPIRIDELLRVQRQWIERRARDKTLREREAAIDASTLAMPTLTPSERPTLPPAPNTVGHAPASPTSARESRHRR